MFFPGGESFAGRQQGSGTELGAGGSNCQAAPQEEGGGEDGGGERQVKHKCCNLCQFPGLRDRRAG